MSNNPDHDIHHTTMVSPKFGKEDYLEPFVYPNPLEDAEETQSHSVESE